MNWYIENNRQGSARLLVVGRGRRGKDIDVIWIPSFSFLLFSHVLSFMKVVSEMLWCRSPIISWSEPFVVRPSTVRVESNHLAGWISPSRWWVVWDWHVTFLQRQFVELQVLTQRIPIFSQTIVHVWNLAIVDNNEINSLASLSMNNRMHIPTHLIQTHDFHVNCHVWTAHTRLSHPPWI